MTELRTKRAEAPLQGEIEIPGDKSISHRAIMLSAISSTAETEIDNFLEGEDVLATIEAFKAMGVKIEKNNNGLWYVYGVGLHGLKKPNTKLDMGNSGTSARLIMGILAGQDFESIIDGDESLRKRPMKRITEPLSQMGAKFEFLEKDGCLPIKVIGNPNLQAIEYELPVASAQIKSAILLAGLYADGETSIIEKETSRNHTETMFKHFGIVLKKINDNTIQVQPEKSFKTFFDVDSFTIPSDPSSAAFFITASLLVKDSEISFANMGLNKTRKGFLDIVVKKLKCKVEIDKISVLTGEPYSKKTIAYYSEMKNRKYTIPSDFAPLMIDEYPILAVLAAGSKATVRMEGIGELRVKESDRIAVMEKGLKACGVDVESGEDWMEVRGTGKVEGGATIETHLDHRIAMSFIILGLIAENPITIDDISPIQTSFPNFFTELKKLGVDYGI